MLLKDLKAGNIVVNANKLVIFLSALTLNKFKAYFICSCTSEDLLYNKDYLIEYAKKILGDILVNPAKKDRVITTSSAQDKDLVCLSEIELNPEYFKAWYIKSKFVCELPDLYDMKDFREKKLGEQNWVNALNVTVGEVYTTKSQKKFLLCLSSNNFLIVLKKEVELLRYQKYPELLTSLIVRRREARDLFYWYYYPEHAKLYSTNVMTDEENIVKIKEVVK